MRLPSWIDSIWSDKLQYCLCLRSVILLRSIEFLKTLRFLHFALTFSGCAAGASLYSFVFSPTEITLRSRFEPAST